MREANMTFERGVVRPMECFRQGWALIREQYWLFFGITVVGVLIASFVPFYIALGPAMCGIYLCALRLERGKPVKFDHLMRGIDYFAQSLIATMIMVVPVIVILVPAYLLFLGAVIFQSSQQKQGAPPDPDAGLAILIGGLLFALIVFVLSIVVSALFMFTFPLIVDRKLTGVQAVKTSIKAAWANIGGVLGFTLLNMLISCLGALVCCVGTYFVMPIHMAAVIVAYRAVFPALPEPDRPMVEQDPNDPNRSDYDELDDPRPMSGDGQN